MSTDEESKAKNRRKKLELPALWFFFLDGTRRSSEFFYAIPKLG